jgi:hypothetical protein
MATRKQTETIATIRAKGLTCRCINGEFRISFPLETISAQWPSLSYNEIKGKNEALAYYTDCAIDAIGTANAMLTAWGK